MKVVLKSVSKNCMALHIVKAIKDYTGLDLRGAKDIYDAVKDGKESSLEIPNEMDARDFISEVKDYGLECGNGDRKNIIKRFYKVQSECPDVDDIIEYLDYSYHITALNKNDGCRYMISDFRDTIIGMKYGDIWKTSLNIEDFERFEINHVPYIEFYTKFYQK